VHWRRFQRAAWLLALLSVFLTAQQQTATGQAAVARPAEISSQAWIRGTIMDSSNRPVSGATVRLKESNTAAMRAVVTDASGGFAFSVQRMGGYLVSAEKAGLGSATAAVASPASSRGLVLILDPANVRRTSSADALSLTGQGMEFSDKPSFTVAGVTDWTAVGGHGSDSTLRTSEDLARETLTLQPQGTVGSPDGASGNDDEVQLRAALVAAPQSYAANHALGEYYLRAAKYEQAIPVLRTASAIGHAQAEDEYALALACRGVGDFREAREHVGHALAQSDSADLHRLAGELDEQLGDPLAAVQQEERAARLDPSEENYFAWGSELLLHRAVWQAAEVFKNGAKAHPASARMLTAWGAALFAGALYDEAAQRLCEASDLNPADPQPYIFMGKIELAAPAPPSCVEQKLARFVQEQPRNATAKYLYAMAISRREDHADLERVESLLLEAVTLDRKCSEAYLQLGILSFAKRDYAKAIEFYTKALEANPQMTEAHYRLGVAYSRTGEPAKAKRELQLHDELDKAQAEAVEQQRRAVKQFLVVLRQQPGYAASQ
jgi:tetratricopeptide (TPR) repeat protein